MENEEDRLGEGVVLAWRSPAERVEPQAVNGAQAAGALAGSIFLGALGLLAFVSGIVPTF